MSQDHSMLTSIKIAFVLGHEDRVAYVEYEVGVPMAQVVATIQEAESKYALAFDVEDENLWEHLPDGCTRIHAIFRDDLREE